LHDPLAAEVDQGGVPRSPLDAIAKAGLLGVVAPASAGGADAGPAVLREVAANPSPAAARYLHRLATGELIAGIAFSHLRRFPQRPVTATRVATGWRLDGVAPWYTGWGLNDVAFIAGVSDDDQVVFGVVPARENTSLRAKTKLRMAALDAAQTVVLQLDGVQVDDADVALVQPVADWLATDRQTSANANPAIFGIAKSAVRLLAQAGEERGEPATQDAAAKLAARLVDVRKKAYALADDDGEPIDDRLATRAEALDLLIAITSALVAANSGPAMALTHPAQRKAREALFLLVQAQTAAGRATTLTRWGNRA
jgi:alkylation response protein AidB-like acyl-CoA dehydrogenase